MDLKGIDSEIPAKQIEAFNNCMKIIEKTGKDGNSSREKYAFPTQMLKDVFVRLLSEKVDNSKVIYAFQKYSAFNDVLFHSWEVLKDITPKATPSEAYQKNYLNLVDRLGLKKNPKMKIQLKSAEENGDDSDHKIFCEADGGPTFHFDVGKAKRWISICWSCISTWKLTKDTHKRTLLILLDRLLSYLQDPLKATDFLMDSLNMGGAVTMLSLQGLSTLIIQHHLECPILFTKLYSMFEPELFTSKHKSRLIYLTDIFLSSTTLSSALVAAFAKRMCRLALVCSHKDVYVLLHFVGNLIVRFPDLKKLRGRALDEETKNFGKDPYIASEENPSLSNALSSCFWEAAVLRNHVLPPISKAANRVLGVDNNPMEIPIGNILDDDETFDEFKKAKNEIFLNHNRNPSSHDFISNFWQLC